MNLRSPAGPACQRAATTERSPQQRTSGSGRTKILPWGQPRPRWRQPRADCGRAFLAARCWSCGLCQRVLNFWSAPGTTRFSARSWSLARVVSGQRPAAIGLTAVAGLIAAMSRLAAEHPGLSVDATSSHRLHRWMCRSRPAHIRLSGPVRSGMVGY